MRKTYKNIITLFIVMLVTISVAACAGPSENKSDTTKKAEVTHQEKAQIEKLQKENRELKKAERERQDAVNVFQFSEFALSHEYNQVLPYNGIKMSFVVQNTSNRNQTLRLRDFVLKKQGSNTVRPETALRNHTGIARNPANPDFSDSKSDLNEREMFPGDRFLVKIEFWEQTELIKSLEGWQLFYVNNNGSKAICSLHD